jgi:threonyl-tRNA synthetase
MGLGEGSVVTAADYKPLEIIAQKAIKEKQPFERLVVSKENLIEMFKHNKYKQTLIGSKISDGTSTTVYRCGPLIDLCIGPHVPHTGRIKAFQVMKVVMTPSLLAISDKNMLMKHLFRIRPRTSWVMLKTILFNASTVSVFRTRSNLRNTRNSSKKLPGVTTEK